MQIQPVPTTLPLSAAAATAAPTPQAPPAPVDRVDVAAPRLPTSRGNEVTPLLDGDAVVSGALAAMQNAKAIRLEMYRLGYDKLVDVLAAKAREGASVQVLLDPSVYDEEHRGRRDAMVEYLRTSGVEVGFYPIEEKERRIDHVKLLIVDNQYALVAGMNWDSHSPINVDQGVMVQGPAVSHLTEVFENDWRVSGETVKPLPPPPPQSPEPRPIDGKLPVDRDATIRVATTEGEDSRQDIRAMMRERFDGAKKSIYLEAFAIADKEVLASLCEAAKRGVDVRVMLDPNKPIVYQNRKSAQILEAAGVKVKWLDASVEKEEKLHSKFAVVDDDATILGSANFTYAGLSINHEANIDVVSKAMGAAFSKLFMDRWENRGTAKPKDLPDYQERVPEESAGEQYAREIFRGFTDYLHPDTRRNWVGKRRQAVMDAMEEHKGDPSLKHSPRDSEETTIGKVAALLDARGLTVVKPDPGTRDPLWQVRLRLSAESAADVAAKAPERLGALSASVPDAGLQDLVRRAQELAPVGYRTAPADNRADGFPADTLRPGDLDYKPGRGAYEGGGRILADRRAQVLGEVLSDYYGLQPSEKAEVLAALAVRNLALGVAPEDMEHAPDPRRIDWKPWPADRDRRSAGMLLGRLDHPKAAALRALVEVSLDGPPAEKDLRHQVMFLAARLSEAPNFYVPC